MTCLKYFINTNGFIIFGDIRFTMLCATEKTLEKSEDTLVPAAPYQVPSTAGICCLFEHFRVSTNKNINYIIVKKLH